MLSYNPLKTEIQNVSIGVTLNNELLGVTFTNSELEISNFPTDYATESTLNSIDTKIGNVETNTSGLATQSTLNSVLTTMETPQITRYFNDNNLFTITQRLGNFSASGTYYWNQYNDTKYVRIDPYYNTVAISSSSAGDTNKDVYIEGYNADGDKLSEILTLNGQSKVTSSNSYIGITDFHYASDSGQKTNGTAYLYRNSESITNGVPNTFKYACMTGINRVKKGYIGHIYIPNNKTLQIHNIQLNKCAGSSNHTILLNQIVVESGWSPLHIGNNGMIIAEWIVSGNHFFDYKGSWIIPNNISTSNGSFIVLECLSSAIDTSAIIECKITFSFI